MRAKLKPENAYLDRDRVEREHTPSLGSLHSKRVPLRAENSAGNTCVGGMGAQAEDS